MFLTVHSALGIVIGQQIQNPILAFILGFISHFFSDIIPHGDTKVPKRWKNLIYLTLAAFIDSIFLIIFLLWVGSRIDFLNISSALAIFGALLPDFLQGFYFLSYKKKFANYQKFHYFFHNLITQKFEWNFCTGIIFQIIIFIILITFIL